MPPLPGKTLFKIKEHVDIEKRRVGLDYFVKVHKIHIYFFFIRNYLKDQISLIQSHLSNSFNWRSMLQNKLLIHQNY